MVAQGKITTDRETIKQWILAHKGWPAIKLMQTADSIETVLAIVFPGDKNEDVLRRLSWEEFFQKFDQLKLVFLYEEVTDRLKPELSYAFV